MKRIRWCLIAIAATVLVPLFLGCGSPPAPNSVAWLAREYGVSPEKVRSIASALDVDPEKLATFGPANFPLNYFQQRVAEIRERTGLVTSEDVETLIQGYEARCDNNSGWPVDYLFYSQNISPGIFGSGALVIRVVYWGLSPEVAEITFWNLRDDSAFAYERKWAGRHCRTARDVVERRPSVRCGRQRTQRRIRRQRQHDQPARGRQGVPSGVRFGEPPDRRQ